MSLHYGQEIFEGLKAYRQPDGSIASFRPDANARPIPPLVAAARDGRASGGTFVESLRALVDVDRDWVPEGPDASLYFRPFMIATEVGLGVTARRTPTPTCSSPHRRVRTSRAA